MCVYIYTHIYIYIYIYMCVYYIYIQYACARCLSLHGTFQVPFIACDRFVSDALQNREVVGGWGVGCGWLGGWGCVECCRLFTGPSFLAETFQVPSIACARLVSGVLKNRQVVGGWGVGCGWLGTWGGVECCRLFSGPIFSCRDLPGTFHCMCSTCLRCSPG